MYFDQIEIRIRQYVNYVYRQEKSSILFKLSLNSFYIKIIPK